MHEEYNSLCIMTFKNNALGGGEVGIVEGRIHTNPC